jgi:hypothetical protein
MLTMTLAVTYDKLRREVGRFLGYGRTTASWSSTQTEDVADILESGLRRFYFPLVSAGEGQQGLHRWSFLQPLATLEVSSGTRAYDLPEDFAGGLECFTFAAGSDLAKTYRAEEEKVRSLHAKADLNGPPRYFAIRPKVSVDGVATRYEVIFYPVPDATYTLSYRYAVEPGSLDAANSMPLGGAVHGETILEACLAAAEKLNDEEGLHSKRFAERMSASIQMDLEQSR